MFWKMELDGKHNFVAVGEGGGNITFLLEILPVSNSRESLSKFNGANKKNFSWNIGRLSTAQFS